MVKPELLTSSSSTRSLPIRSLNVVGDLGTVCGALLLDGLALCRACERERWPFAEPVDLESIFNPIIMSDNWFAMYSLTTDQISSPALGRKVVVEGFLVVQVVDPDVSYPQSLPGNNKISSSMGLECWPIFDCGAIFIN